MYSLYLYVCFYFFFFQAEDGIRDSSVTGVQTCALPISEEKIGKPVGSDLRAGIPSLPVVLGVERSPELRKLFQNGTKMEGATLERALNLLRDPQIIADARHLAAEQVGIARRIVAELKPS